MKKIINVIFAISLSINAYANDSHSDLNNLKFEKSDGYTCIYEYYEEAILASGDILYVYVGSEVVECEAEDAGKVFEYVLEHNGFTNRIKPKRHGV